MARFLFIVVAGGIGVTLFATKPTQTDYLAKLQSRAVTQAAAQSGALSHLRGSDPVDEMLTAHSPSELLNRTQIEDYYVGIVFTTEYETPGYGPRRIRTVGFFSTLISYRLR